MNDRDKIIKGLEYHLKELSVGKTCFECPYLGNNPCEIHLIADAIELLKEQEPIEAKTMGESKSHGSWWFACGACGHAIDPEDNFCRECGKAVKWDA